MCKNCQEAGIKKEKEILAAREIYFLRVEHARKQFARELKNCTDKKG